nr:ras-related protein Rap1-like [Procambarus clarkii]
MRELSIRSGRAFVIVFAVNNEQSFYEAQGLWNLITEVKGYDNVPTVLVGNKVDLSAEREVSWEEANTFATDIMPNAAYVETSAKYNLNVTLVFKELLVLTFGITKEEKKERRSSRLRMSLSDLSITARRKSSGAMSTVSGATLATISGISHTGSALSDDTPDDENANNSPSTLAKGGGSGNGGCRGSGGGGGCRGSGGGGVGSCVGVTRLVNPRQEKCVIL